MSQLFYHLQKENSTVLHHYKEFCLWRKLRIIHSRKMNKKFLNFVIKAKYFCCQIYFWDCMNVILKERLQQILPSFLLYTLVTIKNKMKTLFLILHQHYLEGTISTNFCLILALYTCDYNNQDEDSILDIASTLLRRNNFCKSLSHSCSIHLWL